MWRQEDSLCSGHKRLLRRQTMEAGVNWSQPLEIVGRGLGNQQQPSGAGKPSKIQRREARQYEGGKAPTSGREPFPNVYFVLAKSLEGRGERGKHQDHTSRDEAPAPAPGIKNDRTSRRFPAPDPDPRLPHPPSVLRTGMAPSWPYLAQKQQPRFPPIKNASRVIPEPGETLAAASVPGWSGRSPDARTEGFRVGQLIRSARRRLSLGAAASREGLEPRQRPLASQGMSSAPLWLLLKPPPRK
ncbi:uncharacterized protein LOC128405665 [Podarcis raffonei]|uniref:uncharacterized protein LOC128405665 n=1 Tax=Podarcis raffonei TaxID=65483 RepID=UPI0023298BBC|nr:uncharacterized protein LOC128405665 [Podarcis raffonei]